MYIRRAYVLTVCNTSLYFHVGIDTPLTPYSGILASIVRATTEYFFETPFS